MCGGVDDLITGNKFHQNRSRGFGATGVRKLGSPIDLACRPYNSSALPCWLWGGVFVDTMLVVVRFRPPHISLPRMSPSIQKPGHASKLLVVVRVAEVECIRDNLSLTRTTGIQKVRRLIQMDIINFADIVLLVSTVCRYNIAQLISRRCFTIYGYYVYAAYFYRRSSVVCLSVCHNLEPCNNDWTDRDVVWSLDSHRRKEPRVQIPECEGAIILREEKLHIDRVKWRHISMVTIRSPFWRSTPSYCA